MFSKRSMSCGTNRTRLLETWVSLNILQKFLHLFAKFTTVTLFWFTTCSSLADICTSADRLHLGQAYSNRFLYIHAAEL